MAFITGSDEVSTIDIVMFPSTYSKYINYNHSKEIEGNNDSKNILHYNKSSAAFNEYNLSRKLFNKNQLKRKLKFNKQRYMNSNFS